jgi:hypothetical protein
VWKKYVVSWEVEVAWRRCKVVVVMTMKPSPNQCRVLWNIIDIESLLFNLKRKGATKQMKINDFRKKK